MQERRNNEEKRDDKIRRDAGEEEHKEAGRATRAEMRQNDERRCG